MPCRRTSLFIGALLGNLEGVCLPGLLRDKEIIFGFRKGSGEGHFLRKGPRLGNLEVSSPTEDYEKWMKGSLWMKCLSLSL